MTSVKKKTTKSLYVYGLYKIFLSNFVKYFNLQRYGIMSYKPLFFILIWSIFLFTPDIQAQTGKIKTVVIDPGHGGKDCGAVGAKSYEKNITLKIALKTGDYIKKKYPDVKVIYTRDDDSSVDLYERADIANRNNADVFISIHCNSISNSPKTGGAETYVMGAHRDAANLNVAKKENASILYEDNADEHYGGFDLNSTEAYIAMSYIQSEYKDESLQLAEYVQNELVNKAKRGDRGVQQAGFLVLYKTAMPSILVEIGFISNPKEENYLTNDNGQSYIASAIYRAFCTYKTNYEKEAQSVYDMASTEPKTGTETKTEAEPKAEPKQEEKIIAKAEQETQTVVKDETSVVYRVQFVSRSSKVANPEATFKGLKDIYFYEYKGLIRYTAGCFSTKEEAEKYRREVVSKKYKDAFVAKFENGKRVN